MNFALKRVTAELHNLNVRMERSGEERAVAFDLTMSIQVANTFLDSLDPQLRPALFSPAQGQLLETPGHLPELKFPRLTELAFEEDMSGAKATIHAITPMDDIIMNAVHVNKFKLEPHQGGTIDVKFRIQGHPAVGQLDAIAELIGDQVSLSIEPPQ